MIDRPPFNKAVYLFCVITLDFRSNRKEQRRVNEYLRKEVKLLKALQGISYKEIAEFLEIRQDSLYNWLCGYYDLGTQKQKRLNEIIETLKE